MCNSSIMGELKQIQDRKWRVEFYDKLHNNLNLCSVLDIHSKMWTLKYNKVIKLRL